MKRTLTEVAKAVRQRRLELGRTQVAVVEKASEELGAKVVAESTYRAFESGRSEGLSERSAVAIAVGLDWPRDAIDRLLAGEDPASFVIGRGSGVAHDTLDDLSPEERAKARAYIDGLRQANRPSPEPNE